jgi:hypothetical protein
VLRHPRSRPCPQTDRCHGQALLAEDLWSLIAAHLSRFLISLVEAIPALKGLCGRAQKRPSKLHADWACAFRAHGHGCADDVSQHVSRDIVWSPEIGSADGVGASSASWDRYTAFSDCALGMSGEQTSIMRSFRLITHLLAVCRAVLFGASNQHPPPGSRSCRRRAHL